MRPWLSTLLGACLATVVVSSAGPAHAADRPAALVGSWQCRDALLGWDMHLAADGRCELGYHLDGARVRSEGRWAVEHGRLVLRVDGERSDYRFRWGASRNILVLQGADLDNAALEFVRVRSTERAPDKPARASASSGELVGNWLHRSADGARELAYTFREDHTYVRARQADGVRVLEEGLWDLQGERLTLLPLEGPVELYRVRFEQQRMRLTRNTAHGHHVSFTFHRTGVEVAAAVLPH
ncbi:MAG: hypothetical protein D6776_03100 [Planctomycetota bacterium]|nr:MAG: hypothetical protein D6776_03100 [Planctomycetota bacterium]